MTKSTRNPTEHWTQLDQRSERFLLVNLASPLAPRQLFTHNPLPIARRTYLFLAGLDLRGELLLRDMLLGHQHPLRGLRLLRLVQLRREPPDRTAR
jgi:hypothetical protein